MFLFVIALSFCAVTQRIKGIDHDRMSLFRQKTNIHVRHALFSLLLSHRSYSNAKVCFGSELISRREIFNHSERKIALGKFGPGQIRPMDISSWK